jgi:putative DNA primase/helicase
VLFEVVRLKEPKGFSQRRPLGNGEFAWNLKGTTTVLYRLPELRAADPVEAVWICEGEKDCDRLVSHKFVTTTNPMGAGKWRDRYADELGGRHVVVIPDNDGTGRDHAQQVARSLHGKAASVRLVELPGVPEKGDVTDFLDGGGTVEQLRELAANAPEWMPTAVGPAPSEMPAAPGLGVRDPNNPVAAGGCANESPVVIGPPSFDGPPRPVAVELLQAPPLEPAMLPEAFRGWLADGAERMCAPLDYSAAAALVAVASVVGRRLCVRPKRHDDWVVCPNLWGAGVGPPSVLKSACIQEALRPLHRLEFEAQQAHAKAVATYLEDELIAKAKAEAAKDRLKKAAREKTPPAESVLRDLAREAALADGMEPPPARRYVVNDATVEKLGELLAVNTNGLLQFRDELAGFLRSMERQGHEADRGFYLEAWNGFGSYTYDRVGRGTIIIPNVCLSIFGGIQPGPLARYLRASVAGSEADGFMPRFQLLVYPDLPAKWVNVDRWPDTQAKNRAFSVLRSIDTLDPQTIGASWDEDHAVFYLGFAPEAQDLFDGWRGDLENRLRAGRDNPLITTHLAKYRSLMPTLALMFHLVEVVDGRVGAGPISHGATLAAAAWCEYLEAHARRIYRSALDGDPETAIQLAERIKASLPNPFTARDVVRKGWAGLDSTEAVQRALSILEDRGWVKSVESPAGPLGGQPTTRYWINPALRPDPPHGRTRP